MSSQCFCRGLTVVKVGGRTDCFLQPLTQKRGDGTVMTVLPVITAASALGVPL